MCQPLSLPTTLPDWATRRCLFIFVADGVASAIAQAKETAGERHVQVNGARIAQQGLPADLVDKVQIELVLVVLGRGSAWSIS